MGGPLSGATPKAGEADLDRRRFLRKAAVAGGTAWAVPTLISMGPVGAADLTSPPPVRPNETDRSGSPTRSGSLTAPPIAQPQAQVRSGVLARTGTDVDRLTAAGLGLTAAGGALAYWSADRAKKLQTAPVEVDPPTRG